MPLDAPCMACLCDFVRVFSCLVDAQFRVEWFRGFRGVRNPMYGVLLGGAGRAMGRQGWRLERACISNVKCYLYAEGDGEEI